MDIKIWSKDYITNLKKLLDELDIEAIRKVADLLWEAYQNKKIIFVVGNGGSAATASHIACDFSKTVIGHKGDAPWPPFKIISLTDNYSLISAWSNDVNYEKAYVEQLKTLGSEGDVLIAISSSGNSKNIISCVELAKKLGIKTIGIAGFGGGKLLEKSDVTLVTNSQEYGPVEDVQLILNHLLVFYFYNRLSSQ